MNSAYPFVADRAGHRCEYCHAPEAVFNFPFEVEHIVPTSRGGTRDSDNLALACRSCNVFKAAHECGSDEATPLFHPRRDMWTEHFEVDVATATIISRTLVGRGTIERLQMNCETQQRSRMFWIELGLYP